MYKKFNVIESQIHQEHAAITMPIHRLNRIWEGIWVHNAIGLKITLKTIQYHQFIMIHPL